MRTSHKLILGTLAGAGVLWGLRTLRRSQRRIDLAGRVVVITGASSGHGLMVAREAASRHAHLVIAARSLDQLRDAEAGLRAAGAASVLSVATDVSDEGQVRSLIDQAVTRHGRVDVLINNAGQIQVGPIDSMTLDDYREAMAVNFWGAVYATLAVVPHMKAQGFGRIGNVVSIGGKIAAPHLLPYTASKFALTGFTEGIRAELVRDDILVTGLYPATIRTAGHTHASFKGDHQAEYTWFSLSDTLPVLSSSAEHSAAKFLQAVCDGESEVLVGWPTYAAIVFQSLLPNETAELSATVNRYLLPAPIGHPNAAVRGEDLGGKVPDFLNRMIPPAARPGPA